MAKTDKNLTGLERGLLVIPLAGGFLFGILPLFPAVFAKVFNFSGLDGYIYQLAGAATFGYVYPLLMAVLGKVSWQEIKLVIKATLVFNIVSLYACYRGLTTPGEALPVVYLVTVTSIAIIAITGMLLKKHGLLAHDKPTISGWVIVILGLATLSAAVFGIFPQFVESFSSLFGYLGKDAFIFRQAGAATFGYAVMGLYELRSRNFEELRLPLIMGATFNGIALLVSLLALVKGEANLLVYVVLAATIVFTTGLSAAVLRKGK